jgi:hypothetical protein
MPIGKTSTFVIFTADSSLIPAKDASALLRAADHPSGDYIPQFRKAQEGGTTIVRLPQASRRMPHQSFIEFPSPPLSLSS